MITELFIEDYKIELQDGVNFAITKEFSELDNPTIICNEWSKTLEIPFSENNNKIFGGIFNVERDYLSASDDLPNIGINFNPSKKAYFDIYHNKTLIIHGYCKLNDVDNVNMCYNVTLFGILGVTFNELKQCSFNIDKASQSTDVVRYFIPLPIDSNIELNKELIKASWDNQNPKLDIHDENIGITDIIGFAPDFHGYNEDFDSKTVTDGSKFQKLEDILNTKHNIDYGDVLLGDGLYPQQMREFRSKYQKPYVYVNKIWQLLVDKSKEFAEDDKNFYPIELDGSWFNPNNPYYTDLVLMCNDYIKQSQTIKEIDSTKGEELAFTGQTIGFYTDSSEGTKLNTDYLHFEFKTGIPSTVKNVTLQPYKRIEVEIVFEGSDYNVRGCFISACRDVIVNKSDTLTNYVLKNKVVDNEVVLYADIPIQRELTTKSFTATFNTFLFDNAQGSDNLWWVERIISPFGAEFYRPLLTYTTNIVYINNYNRYHNKFIVTLSNIWNPDIKPFDVLINYAKMFNLIWVTDYENKVIRVLQRSEYFKEYCIKDWTDKVNIKDTYSIKQPTFDDKYINWNYQNLGTDLVDEYEKRNNMAYGTYNLITENDFTNTTKELFSDIQSFNMVSPTMPVWNSYYRWEVGTPIVRYHTTEVYMDDIKDDKSANISYSFAFRCANQPIDRRLGDSVYLTDDCEFETATNTFCYHDFGLQSLIREDCIEATTMPLLSFIDKSGKYCCLFNIPKTTYFNKQNIVINNTKSIYDLFWNEYVIERYNPRNKIITVDAYVSPLEFSQFNFNNFIKIGNVLFIVNKFNDYNIADGIDSKIELQTVRDLSAYQKGVVIPYADITPQVVNITDNASTYNQTGVSRTIHIFSNTPWKLVDNTGGSWYSFNKTNSSDKETELVVTRNPWVFSKLPSSSSRTANISIVDASTNEELGYFIINNRFFNTRK